MPASTPLLVAGAGGALGRRVVELLLEAEAGPVIAATRSPEKLADLAARGVTLRRADLDEPATLETAFAGAGRLLLVSTGALLTPGQRLAQHRAAIAAAERAGVSHLVYTSSVAPLSKPAGGLLDDHFWTEAALFASRLDWTVLRNNLYAEVILMGIGHALQTGQLFSATAGAGRSYVSREDCARAAAAALASAEGRAVWDVTGPAAVTQDALAALVAELAGRPLRHVAVGPEDLRQGLLGAGLPPILAEGLVDFDVAAAQGYHAVVTLTVAQLTGRRPTSLPDFLAANRAALTAAAA
ncbi:NAD(P)H dehydrogenase (quinone) [Tistlia consotensis]|uniref:NAD(P)H dehydrogenase (Quinone) n=1 Tax=Tistlia consotensis USBA 355 TaxID=560819 RepID=A0A1Y6BCM3_9PROT|nr:NAD(P)H-binding protein [Tistlia consotensis]SMF02888.1 NAD(P)H dehydrogenase (quinone) [Tistlia consotensis USBA 355]SNR53188.1 NAD(P)H dehydrogenase (quinone) [Tistlia consotensis]